ncbi:MAG: O-antigen ligase family protein [Acidobacteriota bacterium]
MTSANKITFILVSFTTIFVTVAYGGVHQPILAVFYLLVAAMAIFSFVDALQAGVLRIDKSYLQLPLYAAAVYGFIQIVPFGSHSDIAGLTSVPRTISADPFSTLVNTLHFLALAVFFSVTLTTLSSASRIKKTVAVIVIFGFLFSFFAILQSFLSPTRIYGIYEARFATPFGSFVNRHNFAAFVEMCLCIPLGMLFGGSVKRDRRLLFVTAASLMGIALILSGSRGGFVALLAGLIVIVVLTKRSKNKKDVVLKAGLAAALVVLIVGGAIFVGGDSSLTRFVETAQSKDISTNRFYIWGVTAKVIGANMPFGAGLGALGVAFTPFDTNSGLERVEQAHNDYLQVLSDAGLIGLAIGGIFLFLFFSTGLKNVETENQHRRGIVVGAFGGCCAVLVHSLFDFVLHTTAISLLFLITLGLVVAAGRQYADDDGKEKPRRRRSAGNVAKFEGSRS